MFKTALKAELSPSPPNLFSANHCEVRPSISLSNMAAALRFRSAQAGSVRPAERHIGVGDSVRLTGTEASQMARRTRTNVGVMLGWGA